MPLFEYECLSCGHVFEVMLKRTEPTSRPACPECRKTDVERLWSPFAGRVGESGGCGTSPLGFR